MADLTASMRRILGRLLRGATLVRLGKAYLMAGRRGPKARVPAELVAAMLSENLVAETPDGIVLTRHGERWLSGGDSGHQELEARLVKDESGRECYVVVNTAESPLTLLRRRGLVGVVAAEAGEKLRRDYTIGQITPRMGVDYSAPVGSHAFRADLADTVLAARQRFNLAMRAAGPGLADVLFDVCCYLMSPEECEAAHGWPRGSVRVVLSLALERLAVHYGMTAPATGRTRSWRREE